MIVGSVLAIVQMFDGFLKSKCDYYGAPLTLNFEEGLVKQEADGGYCARTHNNVLGSQFDDIKKALAGIGQ